MESHGGYLCQYEDVDAAWLQRLAREALEEDGQSPDDAALLVTVLGGPRIARFAFDGPFTYGRAGARWYLSHHALARRLSEHLRVTVHAYAFDPDEVEQVVAYAAGRRVGGEALRYEDAELPDDEDERAFERAQAKWPLGYVARVLGIRREQLLRIPRHATAFIDLGQALSPRPLWQLFPEPAQVLQHQAVLAAVR
ncbi:MAG: hypothetical protein IT380_18235 [Myxococcales bacterium]|nr:hypothetical protein [Myxococcales bacterium]